MSEQYAKECEALKLIHPDWSLLSDADKQARHHTFMWVIEAAVKCGVVEFPKD